MTIVLAVVAAVAVVVAVVLAVIARRGWSARRRAEAEVKELTGRLGASAGQMAQVEQEKRGAEVRAGAAEGRARAAEQKATEAERRAGEAETRVAEAMRRADEAAERAEEAERAGVGADAAGAVWELERLRMEREWLDVVGPGIALPEAWDGTIAAVVATELSVIRETIGTPSELRLNAPPTPPTAARAAATARIAVEMLRNLARSGEEMDVVVGPDALTVSQPVTAGDRPPDLTELGQVAASAGVALDFQVTEGRTDARLGLL